MVSRASSVAVRRASPAVTAAVTTSVPSAIATMATRNLVRRRRARRATSTGGGAPRRLQPVPPPRARGDRRTITELLEDPCDAHVEGPGIAEPVEAPDPVQDLLARQRETRPFGEVAEEVELLGSELHRVVANADLAATRVDRGLA